MKLQPVTSATGAPYNPTTHDTILSYFLFTATGYHKGSCSSSYERVWFLGGLCERETVGSLGVLGF